MPAHFDTSPSLYKPQILLSIYTLPPFGIAPPGRRNSTPETHQYHRPVGLISVNSRYYSTPFRYPWISLSPAELLRIFPSLILQYLKCSDDHRGCTPPAKRHLLSRNRWFKPPMPPRSSRHPALSPCHHRHRGPSKRHRHRVPSRTSPSTTTPEP
jgi:hypothetical protein